jgi:hypothetical protein
MAVIVSRVALDVEEREIGNRISGSSHLQAGANPESRPLAILMEAVGSQDRLPHGNAARGDTDNYATIDR